MSKQDHADNTRTRDDGSQNASSAAEANDPSAAADVIADENAEADTNQGSTES